MIGNLVLSWLGRGKTRAEPRPDMPYAKVLARCVFPRRPDEDPRLDAWTQCVTDLNTTIKELAAAGQMQVWGRRQGASPMEPIAADHWHGPLEINPADVARGRAVARPPADGAAAIWYDELILDRRQVRHHLPPKWIGGFRVLTCGFIKP